MAEQIKIADLQINASQLISEMKTTKAEVDRLKKAQNELKDAGKENTSAFIKNEAALKTANTTYRAQQKTLQQVTGATKELDNELQKEVKTLGEAAANNKALRQSRENLNLTTKEGQKALELINKKLDKNTDFMKENQDAQVQNKMNVGNYKDSILEALGVQQAYTAGTQALTTAKGALGFVTGKSTGAMKLFRIALASTGIGLLVIALGSLISYLTTTQEGIDKVNRVLTPLKEVFNTLKGQVQELGKAFYKLFTLDLKGFVEDIKEIGTTLKEDLAEAVERGKEMAQLKEDLNKGEAEYITQQAKLKREFKEQKKLSDDQNLSIAEREAAARRAIEIQEEIRKGTEKRLKQEAELIRLQQQANDTSDEEKAELAKKLAEIDAAYAEEAEKATEAQNKLNTIVKQGHDERRKARQEAIQNEITSMEQELELYEEQQKLKVQSDEEQLAHLKEVAVREEEILKAKLANKLISETEYQTERQKLQNDIQAKEDAIREQELQRIQEFDEKKKSLEEQLHLQKLETEAEREIAKLELQKEKEAAEIEALQIHEDKKHALMMLLDEKYAAERGALEDKHEADRLQKEKQRAQEEIAIRENLANAKLGIAQNLSNLMGAIAGEDANLQKAALVFEKGVAAAQVIIQTQIANAKALAMNPASFGQPWIGFNTANMALSLATIGAQAISGVMQINQQSKQSKVKSNKKFSRGGVLSGASHANGGIYLGNGNEAEGGEAIINKRSTAMYAPLLSAINEAGGGKKFTKGGVLGSAGVNSSGMINYDLLAAKISEANMSLPAPQVAVSEIKDTTSRVEAIENRARF